MSFRSVLCVLIISHKEEEKVFSHRKRCASRRVERERERDVTLERSSAFAFRTTPSKSSPRGNNNERELRFSILSLSLFSKKKIKKEKIERKRESASVVVSLLRERVTFRALISSGGGKDGGRFVSDCLSEFSFCFSLHVLFRVYNPNFLRSISFLS